MRKNYIDNLRIACILLLIPYHICMMYNCFGESFYIYNKPVEILSDFVLINWTWFMPLMFLLAGISASYALKKRSIKEFIKERFYKLFFPLLFGILLLIPVQTYFAEKYHNNYKGGYFKQYILFFTKETDLTGYKGGFTPGQLWFILYLLIICILALPILGWHKKSGRNILGEKITISKIIPLFILVLILTPVLNISGKSVGQYFALFLLGYFVFSKDEVINNLEKYKWLLTGIALVLLIVKYIIAKNYSDSIELLYGISHIIAMWFCILAFLGLAKKYLNFSNKITEYLSESSFSIYVFHQSVLIAVAYYVFKITDVVFLQVVITFIITCIGTFVCYEIAKRIYITRLMFGIKNKT